MRWRNGWLQQRWRECWAWLEGLLLDLRPLHLRHTLFGEMFGVRVAGAPILGRKRNSPEVRIGLGKSDSDFRYLLLSGIDVHHGASKIFAGPHMGDSQNLPNKDRFTKKDQTPVSIYHQGLGAFFERRAVGTLAGNDDGHGQDDTVAAALISYPCRARILRGNAQGCLLGVTACMRRANGAVTV